MCAIVRLLLVLATVCAQHCEEIRTLYNSALVNVASGTTCCDDKDASLSAVHPIQRAQGLTVPLPPATPPSLRDAQLDLAYDQYLARAPTDAERLEGRAHLEEYGYNHFVHTLVQHESVLGQFGFDALPDDLAGNSYFITGMSSGIGFQLALQLAKRGGDVFGYARTRAIFNVHKMSAMETDESRRYPFHFGEVGVAAEVFDRIHFEEVDMRVRAQVDQYFEAHGADFANLAGAFLNAGISESVPIGTYRSIADDIRDCPTRAQTTAECSSFNTELHGDAFNLVHLPDLLVNSTASQRALVLTASITAVDPSFPFDYRVVKHAKVFDTFPSMKARLEPHGVSVHAVLPDFAVTDMVLMYFAFQSKRVASFHANGTATLALTSEQSAMGKQAFGIPTDAPITALTMRDAAYHFHLAVRYGAARNEFDWRQTHPTLLAYALASSVHSSAPASVVLFHNSVLVPQFTPLFSILEGGQSLNFRGMLDADSWMALQHWAHRDALLEITKDTVLSGFTGSAHSVGASLWRVV